MVLHRILPSLHQSSSRRRRSRCSRIGQPSHQTWTSLSMSGVGWKRKHGRQNQRILMNSGRHARMLSLLFLMTSSINCMNPCRTTWMQSFKLMEVIQDIKFGSHSTTTWFADVMQHIFVFEANYLFNFHITFCRRQNFCLAKIWPFCLH